MGEVPVSKSTLSAWLSGIELSKHHQKRIQNIRQERWSRNFNLGEWNRAKRQKEISEIRVKAKEAIGRLSERELFVVGIRLYCRATAWEYSPHKPSSLKSSKIMVLIH
jgi:hypothetical protein